MTELKDRVEKILELNKKRTQGEWEPIETAPRDGTEILVYTSNEHFIPRNWRGRTIIVNWNDALSGWVYGFNLVTPTHWMPLPNPPAAINTIGGERE